MARTRKISLYYKLTPDAVISPPAKELQRKEEWIKAVQVTVPSEYEPKVIQVEYTEFNPEVQNIRKFFHTAVEYYAIQNMGMTTGVPDSKVLKQYREEILDELLGFDFQTVNKVIRKRKSTSDFVTVQAWNTMLKEMEETIFESAGYHFPESEHFWSLVKEYGYDKAKAIAINTLQASMKRRA